MAACLAILPCLPALAGCLNSPLTAQGQMQALQQQQLAASQRYDEAQRRASGLDEDLREKTMLLAQEQQQRKIVQDQVAALQDQLRSVSAQLADTEQEVDDAAGQAVESLASNRRRIGAKITANNSLREKLPELDIPGVQVRVDGDVVRVELPATSIFENAGAKLQSQAPALIARVADEVARAYPRHVVGIEGHTSNEPVRGGRWTSNQQLSVGRAIAVFDQMVARSRLEADQLFVVGHAANHPVVSNGTPAGRERNGRVEIVIYPERVDER
jgi:flagellar motor protein MotB